MPIKVLIVDDSPLMRGLLTEIIDRAPDLTVVGAAPDPIAAREMIKTLNPDVLTLDVEMPKMNGLEFLDRLMRLRPMPVVMISTLTEQGSEVTLQALELGAVDFVAKPRLEGGVLPAACVVDIRDKIRCAFGARPKPANEMPAAGPAFAPPGKYARETAIIAIGASTGGTEALKTVLQALPAEMPGVVIVQHMPEGFTASFASRLDKLSRLKVVEAQGGERIVPGHAYLAPGHSHLLIRKSGGAYFTELSRDDPVSRHRPSVDVLFRSVAAQAADKAIGIILTGMGKDGAAGMLEMRQAGAWTIGQDQDSCVVYGMPREAARIGAVSEVVPLSAVADRIMVCLRTLDAAKTPSSFRLFAH